MKKYFKYYGICWAIVFAVFNIITFVSVGATMGFAALLPSFWIGYGFITLAFIGNLLCSLMFFKEENQNKVFLKISVIRLSFSALVASLIAGVVAMVVPIIPYWFGIIVDVLILAFYAIAIVKASAAADIVNHVEQRVKEKTFFIKVLTVDADTLVSKAKSDEIKAEAKKVYEAIRYSDPMSNNALNDIEYQLQNQFKAFSEAVATDDSELAKSTANELIILVNDRNNKCKLLK
ncbi:MAG: hypothetical protein HDT34_04350 [Clostridiales bacterium]|nr:hypothetical protein [Clostridiales bacterium]